MNKLLAEFVLFFHSFVTPIVTDKILKINIAVLVQHIVNYSQKDSIILFNSVFSEYVI